MKQKNKLSDLILEFKDSLRNLKKISPDKSSRIDFTDFKSASKRYALERYNASFTRLKNLVDTDVPIKLNGLLKKLKKDDLENNNQLIKEIEQFGDFEIKSSQLNINISRIPDEIRDDVKADIEEVKKCFKNDCFRSCVILCGRLIEVCLHAKYYKATGFDILDKNPGIGLGKLIAKMQEKNIKLDPGLTQQIHLVNNVRIFSVHKKQRTFIPTKQQTEAIILYTIDVINHLF